MGPRIDVMPWLYYVVGSDLLVNSYSQQIGPAFFRLQTDGLDIANAQIAGDPTGLYYFEPIYIRVANAETTSSLTVWDMIFYLPAEGVAISTGHVVRSSSAVVKFMVAPYPLAGYATTTNSGFFQTKVIPSGSDAIFDISGGVVSDGAFGPLEQSCVILPDPTASPGDQGTAMGSDGVFTGQGVGPCIFRVAYHANGAVNGPLGDGSDIDIYAVNVQAFYTYFYQGPPTDLVIPPGAASAVVL